MYLRFISTALVLAFAAPAIADQEHAQLAKKAGVEPGTYTVHEMAQLAEFSGQQWEFRKSVIDSANDEFRREVRGIVFDGDSGATVAVTRKAQ